MQRLEISLLEDLKKFHNFYEAQAKSHQITHTSTSKRNKRSRVQPYEIMAIVILFHLSGYQYFRVFYELMVQTYWKDIFRNALSYCWFIRYRRRYTHCLVCYLLSKMHKSYQFSYIDSTSIKVCHIKREYQHKLFKGLAQKGYTSVGWFYGFKLHLVIDAHGNLVDFCLSSGNKHDTYGLKKLHKNIAGLLFGDKGYISRKMAKELEILGIKLVTKVRKNMKQPKLSKEEKALLRCRGVIETVIGQLKQFHHLENTKVRSIEGLIINIIGALTAYQLSPNKPAAKPVIKPDNDLIRI